MKKKFSILLLVMVLALGSLGVGYAAWTDVIYIDGTVTTGSVCMEVSPNHPITVTDDDMPPEYPKAEYPTSDPDMNGSLDFASWGYVDKNVGWGEATAVDLDGGDGINETIELVLNNVYPWYYNHVDFWAHNCGSVPVRLNKVVITDDYGNSTEVGVSDITTLDLNDNGTDDFQILWGHPLGTQLEYCDTVNISFAMLVLQDEDPAFQGGSFKFYISLEWVQWDKYPYTPED